MTINICQTIKELYAAEFNIKDENEIVGAIHFEGSFGTRDGKFVIEYRNNKLEMRPSDFELNQKNQNSNTNGSMVQPYDIYMNSELVGKVYGTRSTGGIFSKFDFTQMDFQHKIYDLYAIGLGKTGVQTIYQGNTQIAQIDSDDVICNELYNFYVSISGAESALMVLLHICYMYLTGCYCPGEKVRESIVLSYSLTTNKKLKEKYNPDFKKYC